MGHHARVGRLRRAGSAGNRPRLQGEEQSASGRGRAECPQAHASRGMRLLGGAGCQLHHHHDLHLELHGGRGRQRRLFPRTRGLAVEFQHVRSDLRGFLHQLERDCFVRGLHHRLDAGGVPEHGGANGTDCPVLGRYRPSEQRICQVQGHAGSGLCELRGCGVLQQPRRPAQLLPAHLHAEPEQRGLASRVQRADVLPGRGLGTRRRRGVGRIQRQQPGDRGRGCGTDHRSAHPVRTVQFGRCHLQRSLWCRRKSAGRGRLARRQDVQHRCDDVHGQHSPAAHS